MQLSPMRTADETLKTQNEIGGCLTQQINASLFVMACQSLLLILSTEIMKIKIFYLENMGAERFKRLVLCKGVNTHRVYMKYDTKVFSRGVIRYLLGYS